MSMRVDHIASALVDASAGPTQSIPSLCNGQASAGLDVHLHTLDELPPLGYEFKFEHVSHPWVKFPYWALCRSPELHRKLRQLVDMETVIHFHSLWQMPNVYPGWVIGRRKHRCKLVCSPRGCMTAYSMAQSKWKKRIMWWLGQKRALDACDMFHATCESEVEDIRRLGFKQPIVLLPNGITIPPAVISHPLTSSPSHHHRTLIYLSRIHPEKRVDLLLDAWSTLAGKYPDWDLKVYGPVNDDFSRQMKARGEALPRCRFMGEVTGNAKWQAYQSADLFILPTRTENFGMAIAEALVCGVPAITTKGAPWGGLNGLKGLRGLRGADDRCGWWIDETIEAVTETLDCVMAKSKEELQTMGALGREWMKRDFDWDALGFKMKAAYEWLLNPGPVERPGWVRVD